MGILEKPEVEEITGLSPIIAIEQKTTGNNPRSTVGTITEIYDFLRLLYAKGSRAYSPESGREMVRYTDAQIVDLIMSQYSGRKCYLLAPLIRGRKGHYRELFDQMRKRGYTEVRIDGEILELQGVTALDRYKPHFIELVVDRLKPGAPLPSWTRKPAPFPTIPSTWWTRRAACPCRNRSRTAFPLIRRKVTAPIARALGPLWM